MGSEILYHCPRCALELWHTVLAMAEGQPARVRCNTCKSERNYRAKRKTTDLLRKKRTSSTEKKTGSHAEFYQERLKAVGGKASKAYRIDAEFSAGDLVEHKKFGLGVVLKVIPPDRVEIVFSEEIKMLACAASSQDL